MCCAVDFGVVVWALRVREYVCSFAQALAECEGKRAELTTFPCSIPYMTKNAVRFFYRCKPCSQETTSTVLYPYSTFLNYRDDGDIIRKAQRVTCTAAQGATRLYRGTSTMPMSRVPVQAFDESNRQDITYSVHLSQPLV